jgi:AcrR family transcriptional regulator
MNCFLLFENAPRGKEEIVAITNLRFRPEIPVRDRIFLAGKHLFFLLGFASTTLEAIYREAETNQAEFSQYFGSKEELLQAIFEDAWSSLLEPIRGLRQPVSPKTKLKNLARSMIALFRRDQELRDLLLIEARRVHRGEMMMFTPSYTDLTAMIDSLLQSALKEDSTNLEVHLLRSCLTGAFEGLLRDLALHERFGYPLNYSGDDAEQFAAELVERLLPAG